MTRYIKHIGLLIGFALVFVSFLFFGRQQGTYQILLISGLIVVFLSGLSILLAKDVLKTKLTWVTIVVFFIFIQQLTEPILIDHSYRIFISQHSDILKEVDNILMQKQGDIIILGDSVFYKGAQLSAGEIKTLKEGKERLGVYQIYKFDKGIYYGLWGFLKVRLGITYLPGGSEPTKQYRHLTENWFR